MSKFIYTFCNPDMELWLKEEVKARGLPLKPSFQQAGFLTFKIDENRDFNLESIKDLAFARSWGKFVFRGPLECVPKAEGEIVEVYHHKNHEVWIGERGARPQWIDRDLSAFVDGGEDLNSAEKVSRTYFKTQQAYQFLRLPSLKGAQVLEIGCSPGGSSTFYLEQGANVVGVDPAGVSPQVLNNRSFTYLSKSIQSVQKQDLPLGGREISHLSVDLNLGPRQSIKEVLRLAKQLPSLKSMLFILKTPRPEMARDILSWKEGLRSLAFHSLFFAHLPSHRKETLLVGLKESL